MLTSELIGVEFQLFQKLAIMAAVCGGILLHHIIWVQPVNLFQSFFFVENNIFQSAKVLPLFQHTISGLLGVISRMVTA